MRYRPAASARCIEDAPPICDPSWAVSAVVGLVVEGGLVVGEEAGDCFGALGHAQVCSGWPLVDSGAGEFDPAFDAFEHLDLEGCEEHGEVGAVGEGVSSVEVRRLDSHSTTRSILTEPQPEPAGSGYRTSPTHSRQPCSPQAPRTRTTLPILQFGPFGSGIFVLEAKEWVEMNSDDAALLGWLSEPENPPIRYLTARDLIDPPPRADTVELLRRDVLDWAPLQQVLALQLQDGSFPYRQKTPTAQPTFWALCLMARCGLDVTDEPVARAIEYLTHRHLGKGAVSYTTGGSGVLPCYVGVATAALITMGALDTDLVRSSIQWLLDYQRFDHRKTQAGGDGAWPYRAPRNYGCWETVSCYHGVAAAFRALAAMPLELRSGDMVDRLSEAIEYLRIHRLYKKSDSEQSLFRHMTRLFLIGDYRSDLLDMLGGVADAEPTLIREDWVQSAVRDMTDLTDQGRVTLVKNYGTKLIDPIPFEAVGTHSRFLTYEWARIRRTLDSERIR